MSPGEKIDEDPGSDRIAEYRQPKMPPQKKKEMLKAKRDAIAKKKAELKKRQFDQSNVRRLPKAVRNKQLELVAKGIQQDPSRKRNKRFIIPTTRVIRAACSVIFGATLPRALQGAQGLSNQSC